MYCTTLRFSPCAFLFRFHACSALYQGNFSINKAPTSLKDALDRTDIDRANTKFGFPKDQVKAHPPSPPFPQASKPSAHVVAQQSMAPPQQQYSSNHGRAPSSAPKSTNNTNHHGPGPPVSRPSAEAVQGPSYNNHQYQAIATHLQNSRMDPVNSKNQTQKHSHHPTNQNNKGNSYTNKQHQQTAANPSHSANHNHSNPGLNNTATAVTKASTVAATAGPYSMPPPPTAADALSSLFKGNENSQNLIPHRPNTSNGRRDSDSSRRISIGDGLPIQQASLVTPAAAATNGKRPPFTNIQNMDPTMHKKQHVNPYYTSNR